MLSPKLYLIRNKLEKVNEIKQHFYVDKDERLNIKFGKYQILIFKTNEYQIKENFQILSNSIKYLIYLSVSTLFIYNKSLIYF